MAATSSNEALTFRRARGSMEELAELSAIAWAAKAHWGYPAAWLEAWRTHLTVTEKTLVNEHVVVAEAEVESETGRRMVGFFSLRQDQLGWHLEHCWLRPEVIGRGWGRALWGEVTRRARVLGARELRIAADPHAEGFYVKMGAVRVALERYYLFGMVLRELPQMRVKL